MKHRILWCQWQPGVDEADQDWTECVPNPSVDYSSPASCAREADLLALETEGRYTYRVVESESDEPRVTEPRKTTVSRWIPREQRWVDIETEIAS